MNKVKIIASVNPSNYNKSLVKTMVLDGANVIRLDMSVCDYDFCEKVINEVNLINKKNKQKIGLMLDLEGPVLKTLEFAGGSASFKTGDMIRLYEKELIGNNYYFSINYDNFISEINMHDIIKLSDGLVILEVAGKGLDYLILKVIKGGIVYSYSKVFLSNVKLDRKYLNKQNYEDLMFASRMGIDYVSLSNIVSIYDLLEINDLLINLKNNNIVLLVKVQNSLILDEIDRMIKYCDGIILSRGEMALDIPIEDIPSIKSKIIRKCLENGKLCIASSSLDRVNYSEVSDLASLVLEGVDGIMITSNNLAEVNKIILASEENIDYESFFNKALKKEVKVFLGLFVIMLF